MAKGKFIVIDGADGCGKTTVISYLREVYPKGFVFTREPGGSFFAEKIREIILGPDAKGASGLTQFGLFWAARADHVANTIKPALEQGLHVIADRFDSSSYAFQLYGQEELGLKPLFMQMREVCLGETKPDLYIILDVNPHIAVARTGERGRKGKNKKNHFDDRDVAFHRRVREAYRDLPKEFPKIMISSHDPVEKVKQRVKQAVDSLLRDDHVTLAEFVL